MKPKRKFMTPTWIMIFLFLGVFLFSCVGGPGSDVPFSQPRNLQIYQYVDGRIDLSWDAPTHNPQQVAWYQVDYVPSEGAQRSTPGATTTQTRIAFTDLDPQQDYGFTITPISDLGEKGKTASKSTMEMDGVFIQIQGQILDAYDHLRTISEAYITSVEARSHSDANGAFNLFAAKNTPLLITHNSYLTLFMEVEAWKDYIGGSLKPKAGQSFFLTPIQLQTEVFPQEEAILSDPQYPEVRATVEEGTFDEIVTVSLSSGLLVQASEKEPVPLISFTLRVDPLSSFLKPILVHLAYAESTTKVPAHRLPKWVQEAPKMIDFIRSVQKSAGGTDLGFLFVQRPGIEDPWEDAVSSVNESTFEATILAHQPGEYMVVPDLSIPAQIISFQFATQTHLRSGSPMKVNVLIDWPVFDMETIHLFFSGLLLVNYEFSIFQEESLVERRILQRSFLGIDGIEPRFSWEKMQNAQTDYTLNSSARKNAGYEFLRNGPGVNNLPDRTIPLADNQAISHFFTSLQGITLLDQMQPQTPYNVHLRMRISTPLGIITHQIDLGSFTLEGEQLLPPVPATIVSTSSTFESITLEWLEYQSPAHTFQAYEIWGRKSASLDPWERILHIDRLTDTSALIDASIIPTIRQNQEYAFFIRTINTNDMFTDGPIAQVSTKNVPPNPVIITPSQEDGAITSHTLQVQWTASGEPDFAQYILSWIPTGSSDARAATHTSILIRDLTQYRITHLEADTPYTISILVEDQGGLRSVPSQVQMRTEVFTPPRAPLIQRIQWNVHEENLEVQIIWEDRSVSEGAYLIFRGHSFIDVESQVEPIAMLPKDSWRYTDTQSLDTGATYWYKVEAWHSEILKASAHTSITIPTITEKPSAPALVQADPKATGATITWTASSQEPRYRVWVSLNQTSWIIKGSQIEETSYMMDGLQPDTPYWVKVEAYNAYGSSEAVQSFRTQPQMIQPPANLQKRSLTFDEIAIEWDKEQMASGYYIYRQRIDPIAERTATRIGFTQKEWYSDTDVRPDTTYTYRVTSYHPLYGESDKTETLTVHTPPIPPPLFTLTLNRNNDAWGTAAGGGEYEAGQVVNIQATPSPGYRFVNWTRDGSVISAQANHNYTMPAENVTLIANFERIPTYTLTLNRNNNAWGSVTGGGHYLAGQVANIQATPSAGYRFEFWTRNEEPVSEQANHAFTMPAENVTLVAKFEAITYTLTLIANPEEGGVLQGAGYYPAGTSVEVSAVASPPYLFMEWNLSDPDGETVSTSAAFDYEMPAQNTTLVATFVWGPS